MTDIRFTRDHEYIRIEGEIWTVGITDYAQAQLGDVVYVELPQIGKVVARGDAISVVESVKAASDIFAPVSGEIVAVNAKLEGEPGLVNSAPLEGGWFFAVKPASDAERDGLLSAAEYEDYLSLL